MAASAPARSGLRETELSATTQGWSLALSQAAFLAAAWLTNSPWMVWVAVVLLVLQVAGWGVALWAQVAIILYTQRRLHEQAFVDQVQEMLG